MYGPDICGKIHRMVSRVNWRKMNGWKEGRKEGQAMIIFILLGRHVCATRPDERLS